jgi:peroxiredoxin
MLLRIAGFATAQEPASMRVPAPDLASITAWINSEPLKLADLKGQVVVLHFWTHGCINCIHNYPHMKSWYEKFSGDGVTMIGVHTPELAAERSVERVKVKAKENGLKFPIAVDNHAKTWADWGNRWWPSIYLIDKRGDVRYRWDGELNSPKLKGEQVMRKKIEELLAEKP